MTAAPQKESNLCKDLLKSGKCPRGVHSCFVRGDNPICPEAPPLKSDLQKEYIITETGMNLAIAVLKANRLYDSAEAVLHEIRPLPPHSIKPKGCLCAYCEETTPECRERHSPAAIRQEEREQEKNNRRDFNPMNGCGDCLKIDPQKNPDKHIYNREI